jgi:hypothetical protein
MNMANRFNAIVTRPLRLHLRFSVRALLIVGLLLGGWLGSIVRTAGRQRAAVAAMRSAGAWVRYDWEYRRAEKQLRAGESLRWPLWLEDSVGVDYFHDVISVGMGNKDGFADADLLRVADLRQIENLALNGSRTTDPGLANLGSLGKLNSLYLNLPGITDAGLVHLNGLSSLLKLSIVRDTPITDAGLVHLKRLESLQFLDLSDAKISGAGLVHLQHLNRLERLNLSGCEVTDAGLASLAGPTSLRVLNLSGSVVTDAGLEHLKVLINLYDLKLDRAPVTGSRSSRSYPRSKNYRSLARR